MQGSTLDGLGLQHFQSCSSFFFCLHGLLATTFSSLRFLFNFTSLQSFESGQRGFLFSHFRVLSSILSLSFLCSSVSEALFTLSFSFLSERFFFVVIKLLWRVVEINNTGVTGQSLPPKNDLEHARGLRNSAYAVNLTYETYRHNSAKLTNKRGKLKKN